MLSMLQIFTVKADLELDFDEEEITEKLNSNPAL